MKIKHPVVIWNDVNFEMLKAAIVENNNLLRVIASIEKSNPVDVEAVMILLEVNTLLQVFGGTLANLNGHQSEGGTGCLRIGYLMRTDGKSEIFNYLKAQSEFLINGFLVLQGSGLHFESFEHTFS